MSDVEDEFEGQLRMTGFLKPEREYPFTMTLLTPKRGQPRKGRFDFAWPQIQLAVEIEGGIFVRGRHSQGAGQEADMEKYAEAQVQGWAILRVSPRHVRSGQALVWLEKLAAGRGLSMVRVPPSQRWS